MARTIQNAMHLFQVIIFCIPSFAISFSLENNILVPKTSRRLAVRIKIAPQDLNDDDDLLDVASTPQQETAGLWLDLRQNAVHPKAAMEQLETEVGATSFVDRILLSEKVFQNLIDSKDTYLTTTTCLVLYQSSKNGDIISSSDQDLSTLFGTALTTSSDAASPLGDPIQAIESISAGKWILLERKNEGGNYDESGSPWVDTVENFMDVVSVSSDVSAWDSSSQTSGGLILPTTDSKRQEGETSNLGGVAVACDTNSEVMKFASTLQFKQSGGCQSITDSGILYQSSAESLTATATAVVLPFEIDLWQAATFIFGKTSEATYD